MESIVSQQRRKSSLVMQRPGKASMVLLTARQVQGELNTSTANTDLLLADIEKLLVASSKLSAQKPVVFSFLPLQVNGQHQEEQQRPGPQSSNAAFTRSHASPYSRLSGAAVTSPQAVDAAPSPRQQPSSSPRTARARLTRQISRARLGLCEDQLSNDADLELVVLEPAAGVKAKAVGSQPGSPRSFQPSSPKYIAAQRLAAAPALAATTGLQNMLTKGGASPASSPRFIPATGLRNVVACSGTQQSAATTGLQKHLQHVSRTQATGPQSVLTSGDTSSARPPGLKSARGVPDMVTPCSTPPATTPPSKLVAGLKPARGVPDMVAKRGISPTPLPRPNPTPGPHNMLSSRGTSPVPSPRPKLATGLQDVTTHCGTSPATTPRSKLVAGLQSIMASSGTSTPAATPQSKLATGHVASGASSGQWGCGTAVSQVSAPCTASAQPAQQQPGCPANACGTAFQAINHVSSDGYCIPGAELALKQPGGANQACGSAVQHVSSGNGQQVDGLKCVQQEGAVQLGCGTAAQPANSGGSNSHQISNSHSHQISNSNSHQICNSNSHQISNSNNTCPGKLKLNVPPHGSSIQETQAAQLVRSPSISHKISGRSPPESSPRVLRTITAKEAAALLGPGGGQPLSVSFSQSVTAQAGKAGVASVKPGSRSAPVTPRAATQCDTPTVTPRIARKQPAGAYLTLSPKVFRMLGHSGHTPRVTGPAPLLHNTKHGNKHEGA